LALFKRLTSEKNAAIEKKKKENEKRTIEIQREVSDGYI